MITYITNLNFKKNIWLILFLKKSIILTKKAIGKYTLPQQYEYLNFYLFYFYFFKKINQFFFNYLKIKTLVVKNDLFKIIKFVNNKIFIIKFEPTTFTFNINNYSLKKNKLTKKKFILFLFFNNARFCIYKKYNDLFNLNVKEPLFETTLFKKINQTLDYITHSKQSFSIPNTLWSKTFLDDSVRKVLGDKDEATELNLKNLYKKKYFVFLNRYLINFLQFLFKIRIHLSFKKLWFIPNSLENLYNYDFIVYTIKKHSKKLKNIKFIQTFVKVLWVAMKIKDSKFFLSWLIYRAELMFFKLHKFIPYLLNIVFKYFSKVFFLKTNTKGVFFSMRGKISLAGDSKKKTIFVKYGKHSTSQKNLNLNIVHDQIKTETGVLGVTLGLFFN